MPVLHPFIMELCPVQLDSFKHLASEVGVSFFRFHTTFDFYFFKSQEALINSVELCFSKSARDYLLEHQREQVMAV